MSRISAQMKFRSFYRKLRSVPKRFVTFGFYVVSSFTIAPKWLLSDSHPMGLLFSLIIGGEGLYFFIITLEIICRKRSQYHIASHSCPCCGYSLHGLQSGESLLTICPECGIGWYLPEERTISSARNYRWWFRASGLIVLLFAVYLIWSLEQGTRLGALRHLIVFLVMQVAVFGFLLRWARDTVTRAGPVVPLWAGGRDEGICPACAAVRKKTETNAEGVTTCSKCAAVWRLPSADEIAHG